MKKKRAIVLIDGSNFYFKLKELGVRTLLNLNIESFIDFISQNNLVRSSRFYIGKVRTDKSKKSIQLLKSQQKLLSYLRKSGVEYILGYLLKSEGKYHEKGVDVRIAVDMLVAAYENSCDIIYLVSSDTDLIPAVQKACALGKKIVYVGFNHKKSIALMNSCSESILLEEADIRSWIYKKGPTNIG